jgi:hypothetical protein
MPVNNSYEQIVGWAVQDHEGKTLGAAYIDGVGEIYYLNVGAKFTKVTAKMKIVPV